MRFLTIEDLEDKATTLLDAINAEVEASGERYNSDIASIRYAYGKEILADAIAAVNANVETYSREIIRNYVQNKKGTAYLQKHGGEVIMLDKTGDGKKEPMRDFQGNVRVYKTPSEWFKAPDFVERMAHDIIAEAQAIKNMKLVF